MLRLNKLQVLVIELFTLLSDAFKNIFISIQVGTLEPNQEKRQKVSSLETAAEQSFA